MTFSTIRPRTKELSPLYCCSEPGAGGASVAAANESRRKSSGVTDLSCHPGPSAGPGVGAGLGRPLVWSRSWRTVTRSYSSGSAWDVPPRRCVQADPVLGDELEHHRVGERLGDAADPDMGVSGDWAGGGAHAVPSDQRARNDVVGQVVEDVLDGGVRGSRGTGSRCGGGRGQGSAGGESGGQGEGGGGEADTHRGFSSTALWHLLTTPTLLRAAAVAHQ